MCLRPSLFDLRGINMKKRMSRSAKWTFTSVISVAAIYSINAFLILPFIRIMSNDVMYAGSLWLDALSYLAEIAEVCAVSVCYAFMLATLYDGGKTGKIFAIFAGLTAYKNLATTAMMWIESGKVPELWVWDIVDDIYFTALELVLLLIIFKIVSRIIGKYTDKRSAAQRVLQKAGEMPELDMPYPFERIYDRSNCLLRSASVCALATFIAKVAGELANDVMYIASAGFPKEWITWVYMLVNYVLKALFGVVVYFTVRVSLDVMLKDEK